MKTSVALFNFVLLVCVAVSSGYKKTPIGFKRRKTAKENTVIKPTIR